MKTMLVLAALTLAGGVAAGCAANPSAEAPTQVATRSPDACFRNTDIVNVNVADRHTVYIATRRGYVFRLDTPGGCYSQLAPITVGPFTGNRDTATCVGAQTTVATPSGLCVADVAGPYTDSRTTGLWSRTVAN